MAIFTRELNELLQQKKITPQAAKILIAIVDEQHAQKQQIAQMASLIDLLTTMLEELARALPSDAQIAEAVAAAHGASAKNHEIREAYANTGRVTSEDIGDG